MADNHDSTRRRHPLHSHHQIAIKTRPVSEIPSPPRFKSSLKYTENPNPPLKPIPSAPNPKPSVENAVSPSPASLRRSSRRSSRNSALGSEYEDDDDEDLDADDDDLREKPFKKRKLLEEVSAAESSFNSAPQMIKKRHGNNNNRVSPQIATDKNVAKNEEECSVTGGSLSPKLLESLLDKLQKKDTYAVFAEPVDPEEVPGYYDFIKNPMDFGTMRKKIKNGAYKTLETFQDDIYLVCRNAMTYNAKDTIYYKLARTIQDVAKKILETVKSGTQNEVHGEIQQSSVKKLTSKRVPTNSDCTSVASLAASCTNGDVGKSKVLQRDRVFANNSTNLQGQIWTSKISNSIVSSPGDGRIEQHDYVSVSKILKRIQVDDGIRRNTYHRPDNLGAGLLPILTAFGGESQRMVPMGHQQLDFAYARSLARFSGDLGPAIWKVAAEKIRRALPPGVPFGPGWVLEVPSNSSFSSKGQFNSQPHMQPTSLREQANVRQPLQEPRTSEQKQKQKLLSVPISTSNSGGVSFTNSCQMISRMAPDANSQSLPSASGITNANAAKQNSLGVYSEQITARVKAMEGLNLLQSSESKESVNLAFEAQTIGNSGQDAQHTRRTNMLSNSTSPGQKPKYAGNISHREITKNSISNHPKILENLKSFYQVKHQEEHDVKVAAKEGSQQPSPAAIYLFGHQRSDDDRSSDKVSLPSAFGVGTQIVALNSLPPDLNVSPVSNVPACSNNPTHDQQPDLALQL